MVKKYVYLLSGIAAVCLLVAVGLAVNLSQWAFRPPTPGAGTKLINITSGQGFRVTAAMLQQLGLVDSGLKLELYARLKELDQQIKAGEYHLSAAMSPAEILARLVGGKVHLHRVTVPEGLNLAQIAERMESAGMCSAASFLDSTSDQALLSRVNPDAPSFEGYLFPETYHFPRDVTPRRIIAAMIERFEEVFDARWRQRAAQLDLSVHQVVTLASIIEKETGTAAERPVISSVFHNRLKRRMRLQSDPTVIYGIADFDGNITRRHLKTPTPYNTYLIPGLPPGPIANPGRAAIEAALYPADTPFFFFVSKRDRTHHFSATIEEHNRAVRKYQLKR